MLLTKLEHELPVYKKEVEAAPNSTGIIVVDPVVGFCDRGAMADPKRMQPMVTEIDNLLKAFPDIKVLIFLDTHDKPEPPYPDHCMIGSGEEDITPALEWVTRQRRGRTTIVRKDCINAFIGSIKDGENLLSNWIAENNLQTVLICGDCTDICVLDLVTTMLSARNHGLLSPLKDIYVIEPATATYDLPPGVPGAVPHPGDIMHHIGLYIMQMRGADIVNSLTIGDKRYP